MKKFIYILLSVTLLSSIACERYIESRDPVRSLPDDIPIPINVEMFVNNLSVALNWEISDSASIAQYRIYVSVNDTSNYLLEDSTKTMSVDLNNLITNRLYYFKVAAVTFSGLEGLLSEELFAQVGILSMVISNNNEYTNRTSVQVQFTVSNSASNVQISEDSTFADAIYEQFSGQRNFTLSDGDGTKTVYARLLFNNGASNSELLQDTIVLDTKARIDSVFFQSPTTLFRPADTIIFGMYATELNGTARVSFTGSGNIDLVDDGSGFDTVANDGNYYGWYVVPNNTNVHNATVTGNFSDEAGNSATAVTSFDRIYINTTPEQIELLVSYTSGDSAYFSWTRSDEPDFESYRLMTSDNDLITYEANVNTREFVVLPPLGTTYYRIYVYDDHGDFSATEFIRIDNP